MTQKKKVRRAECLSKNQPTKQTPLRGIIARERKWGKMMNYCCQELQMWNISIEKTKQNTLSATRLHRQLPSASCTCDWTFIQEKPKSKCSCSWTQVSEGKIKRANCRMCQVSTKMKFTPYKLTWWKRRRNSLNYVIRTLIYMLQYSPPQAIFLVLFMFFHSAKPHPDTLAHPVFSKKNKYFKIGRHFCH